MKVQELSLRTSSGDELYRLLDEEKDRCNVLNVSIVASRNQPSQPIEAIADFVRSRKSIHTVSYSVKTNSYHETSLIADAVMQNPSVQKFEVTLTFWSTKNLVSALMRAKSKITALSIRRFGGGNATTNDSAENIAAFPRLEKLTLNTWDPEWNRFLFQACVRQGIVRPQELAISDAQSVLSELGLFLSSECSSCLQKLCLEFRCLDVDGAKQLTEALQQNRALHELSLDLSEIELDPEEGALSIVSDFLNESASWIRKLILTGRNPSRPSRSLRLFSDPLHWHANTSIVSLELDSMLTERGGPLLQQLLTHSQALQHLKLVCRNPTASGTTLPLESPTFCQHLAQGLASNQGLKSLELMSNEDSSLVNLSEIILVLDEKPGPNQLEELKLSLFGYHRSTIDSLCQFVQNPQTRLKALKVWFESSEFATDIFATDIVAAVGKSTHLERLELEFWEVNDLAFVAQALALPTLLHLSIQFTYDTMDAEMSEEEIAAMHMEHTRVVRSNYQIESVFLKLWDKIDKKQDIKMNALCTRNKTRKVANGIQTGAVRPSLVPCALKATEHDCQTLGMPKEPYAATILYSLLKSHANDLLGPPVY